MKRWTIVAFNHPEVSRSVLYKQDIDEVQLHRALDEAIEKGANIFSIRGFEKKK